MSTNMRYRGEAECEPLHYLECGLPDVYLLSGYAWEVDEEGDRVLVVEDLDGLLLAIGVDLACRKKVLSGKEVRYLRKQMELTQEGLGRLLRTTDQMVARWEREETRLKGPADTLLRLLYLDHARLLDNLPATDKHKLFAVLEKLIARDDVDGDTKRVFAPGEDGVWHAKAA